MEDVITDIPPPSRFFQEDLNNFASPSPPLPSPFLVFSNLQLEKPLQPSLLIIALSSPSQYLFHQFHSKTIIGSLILPEIFFSGNCIEPGVGDKSCNIYSLNDSNTCLLVSVQYSVPPERSHVLAKLLIGDQIIPEQVLIVDSIQSRNFRGKLPPDETLALKLETSLEKSGGSPLLKGLEYFPSGSVIDGLAAALLGRCQIKNIMGSLYVSWPENGASAVLLVKSLLKKVLPGFGISGQFDAEGKQSRLHQNNNFLLDSELYT